MSHQLKLGFEILEEIPPVLRPLTEAVVACFRHHHSDLRSVYVTGSVALGEWVHGVSDLDVIGVMDRSCTLEAETARRQELLLLGDGCRDVSCIDNNILILRELREDPPDTMAVGKAIIVAICGVCIWGERLDLQTYVPSVEIMAYERTARARILMNRHRVGIISEPFKSNPRLLARSRAKAAIRVLSSITILRGATFYMSPQKTVMMVEQYAPEAVSIARRAIAIVDGAVSEPIEALELTEQTMELFYSLFPDSRSN